MPKQLAAMAGAVDVANPTLMVVGSFVLKNGVDGNRFESDSLLDWNEVEAHKGADGRVDGMITEMGQTKVRIRPPGCMRACVRREVGCAGFDV